MSFPPNTEATESTVARVKIYLRDIYVPIRQFTEAVEELSENDLKSFGSDYFYFNLLSIFGGKMQTGEISKLADTCTRLKLSSGWMHCKYLLDLSRAGSTPSIYLNNWDLDLIRALLAQGKGLIVCTSHLGAFRHIPADLMLFGFKVSLGLDAESALQRKTLHNVIMRHAASPIQFQNGEASLAGRNGEMSFGGGRIRVLDVEQNKLASIDLVQALRQNEIVVLFSDGNTGLDGPRGGSNREPVTFFGRLCSIKTGIFCLSAASGAPVMHTLALYEDEARTKARVALQHPFLPEQRASEGHREYFIANGIATVYRQLETYIQQYPQQWESGCLLHRWRVAPTSDHPPSNGRTDIQEILKKGGAVRLNDQRVVPIQAGGTQMLLDVETLRVLGVCSDMWPIIVMLYNSQLSQDYLGSEASQNRRQQIGLFLQKLYRLRLIVHEYSAAPRAPASHGNGTI